ncbi:MAG: hypothetical protein ACM3UY_10795 [Methanocella sp.]
MSSYLLVSNWSLLWKEIWVPIGKKAYTPVDIFIELYDCGCRKLKIPPNEEALNDPKLARDTFKNKIIPSDEKTCLTLLEEFYNTLSDMNERRISKDYKNLLENFITQHNLRYFITADCKIRLSLIGLIVSQYEVLKKSVSSKPLRKHSLDSLEKNVGLFNEEVAEENCIRVANNLLEGILRDKGIEIQGKMDSDKLSDALKACKDCFPHTALLESIQKFCKFSNDYPNLRHGGEENVQTHIRTIKKEDAILALSYTILLTSYIADNNSSHAILTGEL